MTKNIYAAARLSSGLTQERAAERLAISPRSLQDYECGIRRPCDEVLVRMVEVYNAQYLALQHVREGLTVMQELIPDISSCGLCEATLQLLDAMFAFEEAKADRKLVAITRDGQIDDCERAEFERIAPLLQDVCRGVLAVMYGGR